MIKYFYYLIIAFILVYIQQSIVTAFSLLLNLNLLLVALIFITIIFGYNVGFIFAIYLGFLINLFSFLPFGSFIIIYLLILTIVNFLYKHVLINLSFYTSLILILIATCLYTIIISLYNLLLYFFKVTSIYMELDRTFFQNLGEQLIWNLLLMAVIFLIAKTSLKKLNLAFLLKK